MRRASIAFVVVALAACSDDPTTSGTNLGVAGASCVRTPDCRAPLQCIEAVCTDLAGESDAVGGGDADVSVAPDTQVAPDTSVAADSEVAAPDTQDAQEPDISDWETFAPDTVEEPDTVPPDATSPFEDCGELGVASAWAGPFEGDIDFNVTPNPLTPSTGVLHVEGLLTFDIECIESKFVVRGTMSGNATTDAAVGEFPFELSIIGTYDPQTKSMTAKMKDGSVTIYGLVIVYFEGDFSGTIGADDEFDGVWSGYSTGTNQQFITGTAAGDGTWSATAD